MNHKVNTLIFSFTIFWEKSKLYFNADETQIILYRSSPGKAVSLNGKQLALAVDDRTSSHVTLFLTVSVYGKVVLPSCVLHGGPATYLHDKSSVPELSLYQTEKGYMEKYTFYRIMGDVFIPYVKQTRLELTELNPKVNQHAALVVDGHKSRYDHRTFRALQDAGISLVILPAHSSHLTQPLDLHLNSIVKAQFVKIMTGEWNNCWAQGLIRPREGGRVKREPPHKRGRKPNNQDGTTETAVTKTKCLQVSAEFERFNFLDCIVQAIDKLDMDDIRSAWRQANLNPFVPVPPCSNENQEDLERQVKAYGLGRRKKDSKNHSSLDRHRELY